MKTLINKTSKTSWFIFEDSDVVTIGSDLTSVGSPVEYNIQWATSANSELITNISKPSDYFPRRYRYTDAGWVNNHPTDDGRTYTWDDTDRIWTWANIETTPPTDEWKAGDY